MRQETKNAPLGRIPLISIDEAAQGLAYIQNLCLNQHEQSVDVEQAHDGLFALKIDDYALTPRFYPGYIAVIDSTRIPTADDYVLVYFPELEKSVMRRLAESEGQQFLLAHTPGYDTINLSEKKPEEYVIEGVVVNTIMDSLQGEYDHEIIDTVSNGFLPQTA